MSKPGGEGGRKEDTLTTANNVWRELEHHLEHGRIDINARTFSERIKVGKEGNLPDNCVNSVIKQPIGSQYRFNIPSTQINYSGRGLNRSSI